MPFTALKKMVAEFIASFYTKPPETDMVHIRGKHPAPASGLRFGCILLVDDMARYTSEAQAAIAYHYTHGEVVIHMAHTFQSALTLFQSMKFDLVVLDLDLQDEQGNGLDLIKQFKTQRPQVVVLANSNKSAYNKQLLEAGATAAVKKSQDRLVDWLVENDPMPSSTPQ